MKIASMFPDNVQEEIIESVVLHQVDPTAFQTCVNILENKYKSTDLRDMIASLRHWLSKKNVMQKNDKGEVTPCKPIMLYYNLKNHNKTDGANFLATLLADTDNCRMMLESFSDVVQKTIKECLDRFFIDANALWQNEKESNKIINPRNTRLENNFQSVNPWFGIYTQFNPDKGPYEKEFIYLKFGVFPYFHQAVYAGKSKPLSEVKQLDLKTMQTENDVVSAFKTISDYFEMGELYCDSSLKLPLKTIREISQLVQLKEFLPNCNVKELKELRGTLMLGYYSYKLTCHTLKSKVASISIDKLVGTNLYYIIPPAKSHLRLLLPHLMGNTFRKADTSKCTLLISILLEQLVKMKADKGWISVNDLLNNILQTEYGVAACVPYSLYALDYMGSSGLMNKCQNKKNVSLDQIRAELTEPYIKGLLLFMAAAGLLDIAYKDYQEGDLSFFDWLRYVRLTNLGNYALGIVPKFVPTVTSKKEEKIFYALDEDRLIIHALDNINPFENFVKEIATSVSSNRYKVTTASFLKNCRHDADVEIKIQSFKKYMNVPLPPVWQKFFNELLTKTAPFKKLSITQYNLYEVNPKNKELVQIINTDPELKKIIIRAENFLFLVRDQDLDDFKQRMKTFGYMM